MDKNIKQAAIANIAATSQALEKYSNEQRYVSTSTANLLERMSYELHKSYLALETYHDDDHHDSQYKRSESCCSSFCMDCLGLLWKDFM